MSPNGMKSGAGDDPFSDEGNEADETDSAEQTDESTVSSDPFGESTESGTGDEDADERAGQAEESLPYIFDRDGVKDDRRMIQYFLRGETEDLEKEALEAIEDELGTDVYLTDLREALVCVGGDHLDEVADELRDWGYRFRED